MGEIRHERSGHRGAFFLERDGKRLAEMTYTVAGTRVIIDHTENARLMPLCPFAKSVFDKTPEYADVLAK